MLSAPLLKDKDSSRRRRFHAKSKNGCLECKKRHMKCDEVLPTCRRCSKSGYQCSYPPTSKSTSPSISTDCPLDLLSPQTNRLRSSIDVADDPHGNYLDLEIMHHGLTQTRYSISGESRSEADGHDIDRLGCKYHFMLHANLAVAALHLYSQNRRAELFDRALHHQSLALDGVKPYVAEPDGDSMQALLQFAASTSVFAMAEPQYNPKGNPQSALTDLLNAFQLTRGVATILHKFWSRIEGTSSEPKPLDIEAEKLCLRQFHAHYPCVLALDDLINCVCIGDEMEACLHAAEILFTYMTELEDQREKHVGPTLCMVWTTSISEKYIKMIQSRHPVALVILAHYACLLRLRSDFWWLCEWPMLILNGAQKSLDVKWHEFLQWPADRVLPDAKEI